MKLASSFTTPAAADKVVTLELPFVENTAQSTVVKADRR